MGIGLVSGLKTSYDIEIMACITGLARLMDKSD